MQALQPAIVQSLMESSVAPQLYVENSQIRICSRSFLQVNYFDRWFFLI